jgi:hypothetical protein
VSEHTRPKPRYFLIAREFDFPGNFDDLKTKLEKETQSLWNIQEKAYIGKYLINSSDQRTVRIFPKSDDEAFVIDIKLSIAVGEFEAWKKAVVDPILNILSSIGATHFRTHEGNY